MYVKFCILFLIPVLLFSETVIQTKPNKCRLGDQFCTFARALYFSYLYDLPLVVTEFDHSNLFQLSLLFPSKLKNPHSFKESITIRRHQEIDPEAKDTLYLVPYLVDNFIEGTTNREVSTPDFNDHDYMYLLKSALTPLKPPTLHLPPEGCTSIAVHLRTGEGYDTTTSKKLVPYKFLSKSSALNMLNSLLSQIPGDESIYVHIFSDVQNPKKMLKWFRDNGPKHVTWGTTLDNLSSDAAISDLYSMASFDYIIRPSSNFSLWSLILGNHKLALITTRAHYDEMLKETVVDEFITTSPEDFYRSHFFN